MYCRKLRVVWLVGRLVTDCNLVVYFVYYINYVAMCICMYINTTEINLKFTHRLCVKCVIIIL